MVNRYYDPRSGRFNSEDPVFITVDKMNLANPQEMNSYSYGINSPLSYKDPTGTTVELVSRPLVIPWSSFPINALNLVGAHSFIKITPENPKTIGTIFDSDGNNIDTANTFTLGGADGVSLTKIVNGDLKYAESCNKCSSLVVQPPDNMSPEDFETNIVQYYNKLPTTLHKSYSGLNMTGRTANSNNAVTTMLIGAGVNQSTVLGYKNQLDNSNNRYARGLGEPVGSSALNRQINNTLSLISETVKDLQRQINLIKKKE